MLAGELYNPLDLDLVAGRNRARNLCQDLNETREAQQDERRRILRTLLGQAEMMSGCSRRSSAITAPTSFLGRKCFFNFNCVVLDVCTVRVGDYTLLGPAVQIYTATHPMEPALRRTHEFGKPIEIGSDVWVGGGAIILPGVRIGSRSVIGAGSVVTREVPDDVFAAGNPCRVIRPIS